MEYVPRLVDAELERLLGAFPAVVVVGPRACGKTTTAARRAASVMRLDQPATAASVRADPDEALRSRAEPALLDEWQDVAEVLGAVKRAIDTDPHPGRFVLTGSVTAHLDAVSWPGTGRLVRLPMRTMTQRELAGRVEDRPSLREVLTGQVAPNERVDLGGYVDRALAGGFPQAVVLEDARDRRTWLDSYVEELVTRDVARLGSVRDAGRLRRYLQAWALNSAGIVDDATIWMAAGIDRRTHLAYEQLLADTFVVDVVPSWSTNRLKRVVMTPKRYIADSGLMAAAARIGRGDVLGDATLLGRVIDTFVHHQIAGHLATDPDRPSIHHVRTAGGRQEVDLLLEMDGGRVLAVEVKAGSAPTRTDARHLFWLRDELGASFVAGAVLHTGPEIFRFDESVAAIPISSLWATG
ncbi:MAG: ATP-binding protein [Acidimicrobiales bacterium]